MRKSATVSTATCPYQENWQSPWFNKRSERTFAPPQALKNFLTRNVVTQVFIFFRLKSYYGQKKSMNIVRGELV